jgi:glycosyltransferase involved in cell wall biosynthesis
MDNSINILHICNEVGLGGTERGIVSICRQMRFDTFRHSVLCLASAGARANDLAGVANLYVEGPSIALGGLLSTERFDVVLIHRAGTADRRWSDVLRQCRVAGIPVVLEINIFGLVDESQEDDVIDCHLHISKSSYCDFRTRSMARGYKRIDRHRVLYIPTDVRRIAQNPVSPEKRARLRAAHGIGSGDFVLLRTGRPDPRKWGDLILDVVPRVSRRMPEARFIFLSAPRTRSWYMNCRSFGRYVRVLPATSDDSLLADIYGLADVYTHSSRRGESFGVSLVEAMAAGLPIVVDSTPWRDNAQIELVDHMETGIIANSPESYAGAIEYLHSHPDLRAAMGNRGRAKALGTYDSAVVCRSLAGLIGGILRAKNVPRAACDILQEKVKPGLEEIETYWESERHLREARSWEGIAPNRARAPFRRLAWRLVDAFEIAARKARLID